MQKYFLFVWLVVISEISLGSITETKNYTKQKDLINGRIEGIAISADGELSLSPRIDPFFDSGRPFIWDLVADKTGNLFIATGDRAKVYRIDATGKATLIGQWDDAEVYALAIDNNDRFYAAISPGGKVYRFEKNEPHLFAELPVKYIWDMLFDRQNRCYIATGDSGTIYQVEPGGDISTYYQSSEIHIRCLAWDRQQLLLAGTHKNGYLLRFNSRREPFVLYDSDFEEIHQIVVANDGTIYASTLGAAETKPAGTREEKKSGSSLASIEIIDTPASTSDGQKSSASGIIRITPDGVIKDIWKMETDQVQAIYLATDQTLLVGTGNNGRLYQVTALEEKNFLHKFEDSQVMVFAQDRSSNIWLATSNLGKIYAMKPSLVKKGSYESEVIDAKTQSYWGMLKWERETPAAGRIRFFARSGNTQQPNSTWTQWVALKDQSLQAAISSPAARFLQWKVELSSDQTNATPRLRQVSFSYQQQNLPPEISSITISAAESKTKAQATQFAEPSITILPDDDLESRLQKESPVTGMRQPQRDGYREVKWQAWDPNKDQLLYHLYFQPERGTQWLLLKSDLNRSSYSWNSHQMPDGSYRLKVIASDEKSNPINIARSVEKISDWFIIDNTAPRIEHAQITRAAGDSLQISFQVNDDLSPIKQVEFSYDMEKWYWVLPQDLVCDSRQESFQFKIKIPVHAVQFIAIKASDNAENAGYRYLWMKE
ncbi:MAG: hypothetical protein ONB16_08005 [candidate division KSB1 bacterium]|nr:hypothetical protein [candidate division KSB1 bacterium]MDZ7319005.1 hypothetical protein [candidate division KSB1 bacterium]MDZ7342017.1 hypothetical protein [candidate division KSB1 bacterium]